MRLLLDENFPVRLYERLRARGIECEHMIVIGQRGAPDSTIVERLRAEDDLVLLTQDADFESLSLDGGRVIISRVPQAMPIERRVAVWSAALERFMEQPPGGERFEIVPSGELKPLS